MTPKESKSMTPKENMDTKLRMKSRGGENMDTKRPESDKILVPEI